MLILTKNELLSPIGRLLSKKQPFIVEYKFDIIFEIVLLNKAAEEQLAFHPSYKELVAHSAALPVIENLVEAKISFSIISGSPRLDMVTIIVNYKDKKALVKALDPKFEVYRLKLDEDVAVVTFCGSHAHAEIIKGAHTDMERVHEAALPFCMAWSVWPRQPVSDNGRPQN